MSQLNSHLFVSVGVSTSEEGMFITSEKQIEVTGKREGERRERDRERGERENLPVTPLPSSSS